MDTSDTPADDIQMIPDETLEKKVFLYVSVINAILWLYVIIFFQGSGLYFVIPALIMTLTILFLYIRYMLRWPHQPQ